MTPGAAHGEHYNDVMREPLEWNHIAIVGVGRVECLRIPLQ